MKDIKDLTIEQTGCPFPKATILRRRHLGDEETKCLNRPSAANYV